MKKILINKEPWQTRIAITTEDRLQNIYFDDPSLINLERTYFKGLVTKVLPGIQTAFVEIGQERAGFLHISELDHELALQRMSEITQLDEDEQPQKPKKGPRKERSNIKDILKESEVILVQVSKEPIHEKGAKLTTCFTLPGRFIVLMPNIPRIGISKKIEDRAERQRLRDIVREHLPAGMGAIIRTTSEHREAQHLVKDITYLVGLWQSILKKFESAAPQEKLHEDLELSLQIIRDNLDDDVEDIISDDKKHQQELYKFVQKIAPEFAQRVKLYTGKKNIFDHFEIEDQIKRALYKRVELKSGGSLIIESTEAMTVIDVNTGRFIGKTSLEDTILKTNLEAAEEIVSQLRLRNIGGLIVIDFIDMASQTNRQRLFNAFERTLRERDKFQSVVLKVSEFGLVQMTRKRSGKTLIQQLTIDCATCKGLGFVPSVKTDSYVILRGLKQDLSSEKYGKKVILYVSPTILTYLTSKEYNTILYLEKMVDCKIELIENLNLKTNQYKLSKA
jgi:ribonuclease G